MSWESEHGPEFGVPQEILARTQDNSWHNDVCPRFTSPVNEAVSVWVDHPDSRHREMQGLRFSVSLENSEGQLVHLLITDDLAETLLMLDRLERFPADLTDDLYAVVETAHQVVRPS